MTVSVLCHIRKYHMELHLIHVPYHSNITLFFSFVYMNYNNSADSNSLKNKNPRKPHNNDDFREIKSAGRDTL